MRTDMYKVIVERPRHGGHIASSRRVDDLDESPRCEGLRQRHRNRKSLNENLRPLERYLAAQVGRPWDKVYAEICANLDRRNTVQQHIHEHLSDFVAVSVVDVGGVLHAPRRWGGLEPLERYWGPRLYVDPRTGLLRQNRLRAKARREWDEQRRTGLTANRPHRRIVDAMRQLHRIDGIWYAVDLARVADAAQVQARPMDVLRRREPHRCPDWSDAKDVVSNRTLFGEHDVYAWRKRQLGASELRLHGLTNHNS